MNAKRYATSANHGRIPVLLCALLGACAANPRPQAQAPAAPATAPVAEKAPAAASEDAASAAAKPDNPDAEVRPLIVGERRVLPSAILNEERAYFVYLPASYQHSRHAYPVMYLLDGEAHFLHVSGIVNFLANSRRMPEMIIIAVGNTDRGRDFTPTHMDRIPTSGGGDKFVSFFRDELIPTVERQYRTAPHRILVGHSLGGLFATYVMATAPELFAGYISISGSLAWGAELPRQKLETLLSKRPDFQARYYFTVGNEPGDMANSHRSMVAMLKSKAPLGLTWEHKPFEREDHGSVVHLSIYHGLEFLYREWPLPQDVPNLQMLKDHYARLTKTVGYDVVIPEDTLNLYGYGLLNQKRVDEAIAAFELNIALYPESANVYDSLGELYETTGRVERAVALYAKAVAKAEAAADARLALFRANLVRAQGKQANPGK